MSETQKRKQTNKTGLEGKLGLCLPAGRTQHFGSRVQENPCCPQPQFCSLNGSPNIGIAGLSFALKNIESNIYGYHNIVY